MNLPYVVEFGSALHERVRFATFELALAFYRGYSAAKSAHWNERQSHMDDGPRLRNIDRADGSEDGNPSGLSEDEKEMLSNAS